MGIGKERYCVYGIWIHTATANSFGVLNLIFTFLLLTHEDNIKNGWKNLDKSDQVYAFISSAAEEA